jgi:glycosyltransferase involved in cell wall biosynthesis
MNTLRIAAFGGFRCIPPKAGAAGADKFAFELYPRIAAKGHNMLAYCRIYPGDTDQPHPVYEGVQIKYFKTVKKAGFDTLVHSFKCTFDVIFRNTADVVHLHSGANSIWALLLRMAGKRVVISQFAMDWKRDKWPWYGKLFYIVSNYLTAYCPNAVAFDNVFTKEYFEKKFKRQYAFVPYGSEVKTPPDNLDILDKLGIKKGEYFLFVGRFIPDKGLHLLVPAFNALQTDKKLVLIGGSPNPGEYEAVVKNTTDIRIIFPGYVYGDDTNILMKNAYAYIQPSLIEGLSPVILTVMGLGTPLVCSDIIENKFICGDNATTFISGDSTDLTRQLEHVQQDETVIKQRALSGQADIKSRFNWDKITDEYIELLNNKKTL